MAKFVDEEDVLADYFYYENESAIDSDSSENEAVSDEEEEESDARVIDALRRFMQEENNK